MFLDHKLTWFNHIQFIKNKISKGIGILCKARKIFTVPTLETLYYSLIYPYLSYCVEVWGGASNKLISTLFKLQKKAVRIIVSAPYKAHTRPIFTN